MPRSAKAELSERNLLRRKLERLNDEIAEHKRAIRESRELLQKAAGERRRLREHILGQFGVGYVEQGVEGTHGRRAEQDH